MRRTFTALALALLSATPAFASGNCTKILADLSFCPTENWERIDVPLAEGMMVWSKEDTTAKMMAQGLTSGSVSDPDVILEAIKTSVRDSLADPEAVTFAEHHVAPGSLVHRGIIAYDLDIKGTPLRLHHSFMLADQVVIQFVSSTSVGDAADNLEAHRDFISSFKLIEGQQDA